MVVQEEKTVGRKLLVLLAPSQRSLSLLVPLKQVEELLQVSHQVQPQAVHGIHRKQLTARPAQKNA